MASEPATREYTLDPVTLEVLKNAFVTIVDEMAEQILRTCHSFVIYCRDFSSALCDREGNTVMQGSQDIAVHVGTLHLTAKAVIDEFGDDIHEGDLFAINDPYAGGTHFNDVRIIRPIFHEGELIAFSQSNGHWADIGGSVPGSFDVSAREHFGEGLRIPAVRIADRGRMREDVVTLLVANTRVPGDARGDLHAQTEATRVAERELLRLCGKYGGDTVVTALAEVQDYVERLTRKRVAELPDGTWETEDYIDFDPAEGEGLVPVKVRLEIEGDALRYDLSGSHPAVRTFLNSSLGTTFSGIVGGTKTFFPDVPLNSGFYRVIDLEYLLVGGKDGRSEERPVFMWYDWMAGGWGGRNGKDGSNATSPVFGVGLAVQPLEGQERLTPVRTTVHRIAPDSGGPGRFRGGCGVEKGGTLTQAEDSVMSYCCDRARSITWGIEGGLPSVPHGVWLSPADGEQRFLGATFSNVDVGEGDTFNRPSAGGGGFGDPLERDPQAVLDDVADGYVTVERAAKDYGVVVSEVDAELGEYELDEQATERERSRIRE